MCNMVLVFGRKPPVQRIFRKPLPVQYICMLAGLGGALAHSLILFFVFLRQRLAAFTPSVPDMLHADDRKSKSAFFFYSTVTYFAPEKAA